MPAVGQNPPTKPFCLMIRIALTIPDGLSILILWIPTLIKLQ